MPQRGVCTAALEVCVCTCALDFVCGNDVRYLQVAEKKVLLRMPMYLHPLINLLFYPICFIRSFFLSLHTQTPIFPLTHFSVCIFSE